MREELTEYDYFWRRLPHRNYYSRPIDDVLKGRCRIFYKVTEGEAVSFKKVADDIVLKEGSRRRKQLKATVIEDGRHITRLIIQSFSKEGAPTEDVELSFSGAEIVALRHFLAGIETVKLEGDRGSYLNDPELTEGLSELLRHGARARNLLSGHPELVEQIVRSPNLKSDLVAVGYRRAQLARFEAMLTEGLLESSWQSFFEQNTWIFGYGLSYHFLTSLDEAKLEQTVSGNDVVGPGKRVDALLKTRGRLSSLCFVEIKRPSTSLLARVKDPYRPGAWAPSVELAGSVAQVQTTVYDSIENLGREWVRARQDGSKTGEVLYNFEPRSILIVGSLGQFADDTGINEQKYRSFEVYRRNIWRPEILTFDELLERARFIVEHGEKAPTKTDLEPADNDPF